MKAQENENQNIFQYHINDHLLCRQSHEINYIKNQPQQYRLDSQKSFSVDIKSQFVEGNMDLQKDVDWQTSSDQKSYQNNRIANQRLKYMVQQRGNPNLIRSYYQQKNCNRYLYNQMRTLKQQQVEIKESHEQIDQDNINYQRKRIKQFEFQERMLKCYYYLKYVLLLMLILTPVLLLTLRKN